jgi:medium-chain acyl-[acyl-carrier-protein] hydrolase
MNPDLLVYVADYEVRAGEIDRSGKMTIPSLLQLMQETSLKHIIKLKASIWDLKESSWVLLAEQLKIFHLPQLGDKLSIKTYPAGVRRIYAYRDYWIYDQHGQVIATASTTWTLMNLASRKIVPIPESIVQLPVPTEFKKLELSAMRVPFPSEEYHTTEFKIGYFHLDWNDHVNNIHYTRFMLESVPELLSSSTMSRMDIVFKGEAMLDEQLRVHSFYNKDTHQSHHKILDEKDKEISSATFYWGKAT